ncbi:MAG: LLM class flavin-dependent oxidoreductase [Actinomycetes bacterium]|jgi:5,10-methylenetetrahydromethanopterin reductase
MQTGVALQPVDDPDEFKEFVTTIDSLGYDRLWLTDSSLHARYVYSYLTLASMWTARLQLGTAVTNPLTRHPAVTAIAASTLDVISKGRFTCGIGAGDRPLLSLGLEPAPVGVLERSIVDMRRLWAGEHVSDDGPGFSLSDAHMRFPSSETIPVFVSASGPKTLQMAGRRADGVILLAGLHPDIVQWAIDRIDEGVAQAGLEQRPHVAVFAYGMVSDDSAAAMAAARTIAAWFPQTVPMLCEVAGLDPKIVADVRAAYQGGEFQEAESAAALLPDEFVERMALSGGVETARGHIRNLTSLGVDSINVFPLGQDRLGTIRSFASALALENVGMSTDSGAG